MTAGLRWITWSSALMAAAALGWIFSSSHSGASGWLNQPRPDAEGPGAGERARAAKKRGFFEKTAFLAADKSPERAASAWPMFRGNSHLTGVASSALPERLTLLWTYDAGGPDAAIESSAAIVDGAVYVGSWNGLLHAINLADAQLRWKYSVSEAAFKASPAVAAGRVFIGDDFGMFHAVDAASGKLLWKHQTDSEIVSSANVLSERVLVGSYDENLYCFAARDGTVLWKFQTLGYVHCTPAVVEGKTFISGCDSQLRVIDIEQGKEISSVYIEAQTGASPAVYGDELYVGHFGNQLLGINWKKSQIQWRYEHPVRRFAFYSSPAVTENMVLVGGRDKMVHGLDRKTGKLRWTFPTKGQVDSSPVIVGDRVFIGSRDGNLYELDLETGQELWRFQTGGPITASPAVAEDRLVIGNEQGKVFCFGEKR